MISFINLAPVLENLTVVFHYNNGKSYIAKSVKSIRIDYDIHSFSTVQYVRSYIDSQAKTYTQKRVETTLDTKHLDALDTIAVYEGDLLVLSISANDTERA